ncbi:hypothetical protein RRG08_049186 [Elysia crispata]|uniref:Uncharacterized protein n=1 Tax=Elysia crispata TaxID=231223 RepID=A0AAE1AR40_9GAST|nr:hypothetical protein RRG08_049186 [Elysia crispata]
MRLRNIEKQPSRGCRTAGQLNACTFHWFMCDGDIEIEIESFSAFTPVDTACTFHWFMCDGDIEIEIDSFSAFTPVDTACTQIYKPHVTDLGRREI